VGAKDCQPKEMHMAREEAQHTREKKHGSNPGTFSPDDDEAQSADVTRAGEQPMQGHRQAQGGGGRPDDNVDQADDADTDEDEEESVTPEVP
jgi:hypothetical protein